MNLRKSSIVLFIAFSLLLSLQNVANSASTSEKNSTSPKSEVGEIENIKRIIGENTPNFIAKPIIGFANALEAFRLNGFNNPFIFYIVMITVFALILRFIWRLIF